MVRKLKINESCNEHLFIRETKQFINDYVKELVDYFIENNIDVTDTDIIEVHLLDDLCWDDESTVRKEKRPNENVMSFAWLTYKVKEEYDKAVERNKVGKFAILCTNRGMWGGMQSYLKRDGEIVTFNTKGEAEDYVDEIERRRGNINNFTSYSVVEL